MKPLTVVPITISDAVLFVRDHHRHHGPPQGGLFAAACACTFGGPGECRICKIWDHSEPQIVGVAIVGRPVAMMLQDGFTCEVTRLVTNGAPNACSMLYRAAWRAAKALGYRRLVTYILDSEPGTSLKAAGFKCLGEAGGGSWSSINRPRVDKHPLQTKIRWELKTSIC